MRKVIIKEMIPIQYESTDRGRVVVPGTGKMSDFKTEGVFHGWASAYEDGESNFGNYTVGLVELSDGTVKEVLPVHIKFLTPANDML